MVVESVLLVIGAYLLGSVPVAYLVAKWLRGIDLRQYGSGNVGASNLMRLTSKWIALPVIIFDLGKGMLMVGAAQMLGLGIALWVAAGLAAIIGHNWPVFLRFNGGRGVLTTVGVALILAPKLAVILLAIAFAFGIFRQLALGTILVIAALPACSWFLSQPLGIIEEPLPLSLGFLAIFLVAVIRRLTVPRAAVAAPVSTGQLLVNRLFFDRDIRDRKAWIHRAPTEIKLDKRKRSKGKVD